MQKLLRTKEDVLVMGLRYIDSLEKVSHNQLAAELGLRSATLTAIGHGKEIKKDRDKYRFAFIKKLELLRQDALRRHDDTCANQIKDIVYSMVLVECGFASLEEQQMHKKQVRTEKTHQKRTNMML